MDLSAVSISFRFCAFASSSFCLRRSTPACSHDVSSRFPWQALRQNGLAPQHISAPAASTYERALQRHSHHRVVEQLPRHEIRNPGRHCVPLGTGGRCHHSATPRRAQRPGQLPHTSLALRRQSFCTLRTLTHVLDDVTEHE